MARSRAPLGIRAAGRIFDLIQRVLHIRLKLRPRLDMLLLHRVAGIDRQHILHVQVFAPLQKFEQPKPIGRVIVPRAGMRRPIHQRPDRLLPFVALVDVVALKIVAAGEAQKRRVHPGQHLHQIDAVAVHPIRDRSAERRETSVIQTVPGLVSVSSR